MKFKTIWKYELEINGINTIPMPPMSVVLDMQLQGGKPCIWALVDRDWPKEDYVEEVFEIFATGQAIEFNGTGITTRKHIGTFQKIEENAFVFVGHVFQRI